MSKYEELRKVDVSKHIEYNSDTGIFKWINCNKKSLNGKLLSTKDKDGYLTGKLNQVRFRLHRLAWFLHYGNFPKNQIDHINGIKDDNRIINLREANNSQNNCNKSVQKNNKLGVKGIRKSNNKYQALICKNGIQKVLGTFETIEEAKKARDKVAMNIHGEFYHE